MDKLISKLRCFSWKPRLNVRALGIMENPASNYSNVKTQLDPEATRTGLLAPTATREE
jgi:hypothetical protein